MSLIKAIEDTKTLSIEKIIDIMRTLRNDQIKDLLKEGNVSSYFKEHFKRELSAVKEQFLKRDLSELLIAPVDLVHYAGLINQIKETGTSLLTEDRHYFDRELNHVLKKYSF